MGLLSKITSGGKQRQVAIEIKGPEPVPEPPAAQALLQAALRSLGEPHRSHIADIELHLSPAGQWLVVLKTDKMTDVEEAELETRAAECLQAIGPRLR